MTNIPANTVTPEDLIEWDRLKNELSKVKAAEMLLRKKIFEAYFPNPTEGTNTAPLANDWVIKGGYVINRDVDIGAMNALKEKFAEEGIKADSLVQYKPSLVMKEYRTLTAEQAMLFDQCLIVKPGSPTLEIALPKKAAKAGDTA